MQTEKTTLLKKIALELCTCTWIEIMTGVGITLYLIFGLHNMMLAVLTMGLFAPLVAFHFTISRNPGLRRKKDNIIRIKRLS
jgi:hypothetical protein